MCLRVVLIINQAYSHSLSVTQHEMEFIFPVKWLCVFQLLPPYYQNSDTFAIFHFCIHTYLLERGFVTFSCATDPFKSLVKPMDPFLENIYLIV